MQQNVNYERIKLARESRGLSQSGLSKKMSTASQVLISKIEKGISAVSEDVLEELTEVLEYPKEFFLKNQDVYPIKHFYFRKNLGTSVKKTKILESYINILASNITELLDAIEIDVDLPYTDIIERGISPRHFAYKVREYFGLPRGPIKNIIQVIEKQGVIVHFVDFPSDFKISGISFITTDGHPIIFINKNIPNSRIVFTVAHELAHLLMHFKGGIIIEDERNIEKEADVFASSFLMPDEDIKKDLFNLNEKKLGELKQYWRVSIQALLFKSKDLETISLDQYRRWVTKINYYGWRKKEPLEFLIGEPRLLSKMIELHFEELEFSKSELIKVFSLSEEEFEKIYLEPYDSLKKYLSTDTKTRKLKLSL